MDTPEITAQSIEVLQILIDNAFSILAISFVGLFMLIISGFFFNALRKVNLTTLFLSDGDTRKVSSTKFWTSVAYFAATVAFLAVNFIAPTGATIEFVWMIYMSTVAGHAAFSKWVATRFGGNGAAIKQAPSNPT